MRDGTLYSSMTPQKIRERLAELEGHVDPDEYVDALWYVRGR